MKNMVLAILALSFSQLFAIQRSQTNEQVQDLYKKITTELIGIRKDFAGAQPKVYTVLDQVDKMYKVTKTIYEKKKALEAQITTSSSGAKKLRDENKALKEELLLAKQKFDVAFKQLEQTHRQLETEKQAAAKLSKERHTLEGKLSQIEQEKKLDLLSDKLDEKVNKTVEAEVAAQLKSLAEGQSLSLTSTSAPSSPR